jgi:hypothetical protein
MELFFENWTTASPLMFVMYEALLQKVAGELAAMA